MLLFFKRDNGAPLEAAKRAVDRNELLASLKVLEVLADSTFQIRNFKAHSNESGTDLKRRHARYCLETLYLLSRLLLKMMAANVYPAVLSIHPSPPPADPGCSAIRHFKAAIAMEDVAYTAMQLWRHQCQEDLDDLDCCTVDDAWNCPCSEDALRGCIGRFMEDGGASHDPADELPVLLDKLADHLRPACGRHLQQNFEVNGKFAALLAKVSNSALRSCC